MVSVTALMNPEESAPAVRELHERQVAQMHRARSLDAQASQAQESGLEHSRLSAILELRHGRESESARHERETAEIWFTQARRLYAEAHDIRTGAH